MESVEDHVEKARHNLRALRLVSADLGDLADWALVVMFFAALHAVCAVLHLRNVDHGTSHARTRAAIRPLLPGVLAAAYDDLQDEARAARYELARVSRPDFEVIRESAFEPLMAHLSTELGVELK